MPKVVILHPGIHGNPENDALTTSFLADVTVVRYTAGITKEELLTTIREAVPSGLTHVSFVYHYPGNSCLPFFPDVPGASGGQPKYQYFSDAAIDILKTLRSVATDGLTMDILACDLKEAAYVEEVQKIETDLGINIQYSAGKIGNPSSGGSWTLESKGIAVNVRDIYFTDGVLVWNGVLIGDKSSAIKAGGVYLPYITWDGINTFKVQKNFVWGAPPLNLNATDFIELSGNEIFDGSGYEIDISGLSWAGLVLISASVTSFGAAPLIKNLGVINGKIGGPSNPRYGGAIVRPKQKFFTVENCWNTGDINGADFSTFPEAGGIAGAYSGFGGGECEIIGCYNTGKIFGLNAGGIVGAYAGENGGICRITECRHIENIDCGTLGGGGGIAGAYAGANGLCEITDCYTKGKITTATGSIAGGIVGANAGFSGKCTISCCYISGALEGVECGGIAGAYAGISGECTISNCYSIGQQSGSASGGIVGRYAGQTGICDISNCYSIGSIVSNSGGIAGADAGISGVCTITDCYSAGQHNNVNFPGGGGITGLNPGSSSGSCIITRSVCNGEPIYVTGGSPNVTVNDCCSNLIVIDGNGCFALPLSWDPTIWERGGLVNVTIDGSPAQYNLPILSCFKNFPCNSDFYIAADDPAECGTPYTTPNSFPLRVNPYVTLGTVLVYTKEAIDALVAGLPLLIPTTRVSWAPDGMPAGSLFRDLGRAMVVKVSPSNPLHAYRFQWVQLIRGPTSEGVGGSTADSWQTGYICVWAASGAPPVFL